MLYQQPANVIFCSVSRFLFNMEPQDQTIQENAELTVKLLKKWLKDDFVPFMILVEYGYDEYRKRYAEFCEANNYDRFRHANIPDVCCLFREVRLVCLTNLCTLSISYMQQLLAVEETRYSAYNHFVNSFQSSYAPSSAENSNYLCATIHDKLFIDRTLSEIKHIE